MRRLAVLALIVLSAAALPAQSSPSLGGAVEAWIATQGVYKMPKFRHALADLDNDRRPDAVVLLLGPDWCNSGGCQMLVFRGTTAGYDFISASTVSEPIRVTSMKSNGWRTLIVNVRGKGDVFLPFDGTRYPADPSLGERTTGAQSRAATTIIEVTSRRDARPRIDQRLSQYASFTRNVLSG